ncbi:MAG: hypothetical protein COB41_05245 [Proteobacteria bacterium]|nr:DUF2269 family protein [Candidatus Lindowbacteria bacterium]PCI44140.1 MAG: hypothetical protein COB41_05245 [Pseudomonadota bacterium]
MSIYLWLKFFHMIGVVMMLGATFCNGVVHFTAMKARSKVDRFNSLNNILTINKLIMFPGFILIILPGTLLAYQAGFSSNDYWLLASVVLTVVLVFEFIWGFKLEKKMETLTEQYVMAEYEDYNERYNRVLKQAMPIGSTATVISLIVVYLMLGKPF